MALQAGMPQCSMVCTRQLQMSQHVAAHYSMARLDVTYMNGEEHKAAKPKPVHSTAQHSTAQHRAEQSRAAHPGMVQQDAAWQRLWVSML